MNSAFYTAGAGAISQQARMNVVANNMANINTTAYKSKSTVFSDLMYKNYTNTPAGELQVGSGVKVDKTTTNFSVEGALVPTGGELDFAIQGNGFFAVSDLVTGETFYTRDGRFAISRFDDELYLTNSSGQAVLNADGEPIIVDEDAKDFSTEALNIGVYYIPVEDGMLPSGYNNFTLTPKNGEPEVMESPQLKKGYFEASNVDMGSEMASVIESQRAFSMMLKMVQTSDEMIQEVNTLRR